MKDWEKQLKIYQLTPPPPKLPLQEYIVRYLAEQDDKYLSWFLHAAEPLLNQMAQGLVVRYAMYGFFLDLKQACVEGILKALQDYDPEKNTPFWWYARQYHIPDVVHNLIRQLRPGFSVRVRTNTIPSEKSCGCIRICGRNRSRIPSNRLGRKPDFPKRESVNICRLVCEICLWFRWKCRKTETRTEKSPTFLPRTILPTLPGSFCGWNGRKTV